MYFGEFFVCHSLCTLEVKSIRGYTQTTEELWKHASTFSKLEYSSSYVPTENLLKRAKSASVQKVVPAAAVPFCIFPEKQDCQEQAGLLSFVMQNRGDYTDDSANPPLTLPKEPNLQECIPISVFPLLVYFAILESEPRVLHYQAITLPLSYSLLAEVWNITLRHKGWKGERGDCFPTKSFWRT